MGNTFMKASGIGRLGQDPDIKYTASGTAIANISIASDWGYKDKKTDEWINNTEWTRAVAFGRQAESIGEYLRKGSLVFIDGRLQTRSWEDKDGNKRYTTEVVINDIKYLKDFGSDGNEQPRQQQQPQQQTRQQRPGDDDIPF
jgi:single-strand DNA-binding protein